jgi:hypothetical protein
MTKKQVSRRDLEKLSNYLDEQLTTRQRNQLVVRLHDEPDLAEALSDLRRTRSILRATPRLKVPHNFILTPEMVGQRQIVGVYRYAGFRMASALATLLFIIVFLGDLIGFSNRFSVPGMEQSQIVAQQEDEVTQPMAEFEAPLAGAVDAFDLESPEVETYGLEGENNTFAEIEGRLSSEDTAPEVPEEAEESGENLREAIIEEEAVALEEVQVSEEEDVPVLLEAAPAEKSLGADPCEVASETAGDVTDSGTYDETTVGETGMRDQDDVAPEDEVIHQGGESPQDNEINIEPQVGLQQPEGAPPRSGWSLFRLLEILLGLTALGTGLTAIYLYRRGRNAG